MPVLLDLKVEKNDPKPGEERSYEIADGVKMVFCWIPAGEAQLGSPKEEKVRSTDEDEAVRGKYQTKGFWLAKYPVTQQEYEAVIGKNPSYFIPSQEQVKKDGITDAKRFPVENVSWDDTQEYLKKLNGRGGVVKVFGTAGTFVLPHEDAWEYAYRGGKGNKQAFYWGDTLNGDKANCNGNYPYGTATTGAYLQRTTIVGSYETKAPHPWKLCDMSGNVYQWCDNLYSSEHNFRIVRGGAWFDISRNCRGANRVRHVPGNRNDYSGFRVCLRLD